MKQKRQFLVWGIVLFLLALYAYKKWPLWSAQPLANTPAVEPATQLPDSWGVMAYNVENLFDTINDPGKRDGEFTPEGSKNWTSRRLDQKWNMLVGVIQEISPDPPLLIGFTEVEHQWLADTLLQRAGLRYHRMAYMESPDFRGIDCGLAYDARYFTPVAVEGHSVPGLDKSRLILQVAGRLASGDTLHVFVNHWPSRVGGRAQSEPKRLAASATLLAELAQLGDEALVLVMGDFNDTPADKSIVRLEADAGYYNAFKRLPQGSYIYRDDFYMLDQIILSPALVDGRGLDLLQTSARVYAPEFLKQQQGSYAGYPHRTYAGDNYLGGYSDHWPVYLRLGTAPVVQ